MCMVSMVMDYGRERVDYSQWTHNNWSEYKEILKRLQELDAKLGEPECHDPMKAEWMKEVEERLDRLESKHTKRAGKMPAFA